LNNYTVGIIGGGPGGYETAIRLNQFNIDCLVVEKEKLGGICLNWGCIPTKALVKSAEVWHEISNAGSYGLDVSAPSFDYKKIFTRKNETVEKLLFGIEQIFNKRKIPVVYSKAESISKQDDKFVVKLANNDSFACNFLILATGSEPKNLPCITIDEKDVLSSTGILKMEELPESLAIIGGGVVGCEFASIFASLGVNVHLIEFLPTLVSTEDEEIAKRLQMFLKKSGIKVSTNAGVADCIQTDEKLLLKLTDDTECTVDKVLLSVGRTPVINIEFDSICVNLSNGAIEINDFMQTNIPKLYAIGDVTAKLPLAHTASKQGLIVAEHIRSLISKDEFHFETICYENIPRCIFTNPEVGSCGLTEQQASDIFDEIKTGRFQFTANGKAIAGGNANGFVKVVAKACDLQIIGMHIIGPNAAELIAQGSILINLKASAKDVDKIVFAHPTLSEALMEAIEDLHCLSIHKM